MFSVEECCVQLVRYNGLGVCGQFKKTGGQNVPKIERMSILCRLSRIRGSQSTGQ